jgi:parallel beta-helix repeat protein
MLNDLIKVGAALVLILFAGSICRADVPVHVGDSRALQRALLHPVDGATIRVAGGTYFFDAPLEMPRCANVTLESEPGTEAVLSAGMAITGWKPGTFNGHACWVAKLPELQAIGANFREMWVNGTRATMCRYPAHGYLLAELPPASSTPWNKGQNWFGYKAGDLPDVMPADAEAVVMNRWVEAHLPVISVDPVAHRIESSRKTPFQLENGDPFFLQGAGQWLQNPGDWYFDHRNACIYYMPRAGESIEQVTAIVPARERILTVRGADHLTLRGLVFSHSEWSFPDEIAGAELPVGGFGQAAIGVTAGISLRDCVNCRVESCRFEHLGNYALELGPGCRDDAISGCRFTDLGAGAIKIGTQRADEPHPASGIEVSDCRISDGGHVFPSAIGIWIGQSFGNRIEHNEICDLYYSAISIGWTWGYGPSLAHDNRVEFNLLHHIGKKSDGDGPILSDMGGVYLLGVRQGTVVANNIFHDIAGRTYGGWGIYLDEGSSDVLVEKNLVYRTTHGGFHLHYGKNDTVKNNIFAMGRDLQIARTVAEPGQQFRFTNNIVDWDTGVFTKTSSADAVFDENIYCARGGGRLGFGKDSWEQWRAAGQDGHSILTDSVFNNAAAGDFGLAPALPLEKIHFEPLNWQNIGPRDKP